MNQPGWVGQTLSGRYQIDEILGQGGMSAVYKSTDPNLGRVVAIKLIHSHLSNDPEFVRRFEEEAKAVAQLRHPNIIQVYDFNHDEDTYYMVLEFVPGETLQERLKRLNLTGRHLSPGEVAKFGMNVCAAVGYAHQRGMIHRDIKPANIMLNVYGEAILMDFGIAKILGGQQHTATGAVVGTALYMSPEQIQGLQPDIRSDIYSLGVTLFEMVSGQPPFIADSAMTLMMMHVNDPVPDLQTIRPETPAELVAVINKALAKKREERYQTAAELSAALNRVLDQLQGAVPGGATVIEKPTEEKSAAPMDPEKTSTGVQPPTPGSQQPGRPVTEPPPSPVSVTPGGALAGTPPPVARQSASAELPVEIPPPAYQTPPPPASPPAAPPGTATAARPERRFNPLLIGGGIAALALVCLVVAGAIFVPRLLQDGGSPGLLASAPTETFTPSPTFTAEPSATPTITSTSAPPTDTPTPSLPPTATLSPTPSVPPGIPFVRINNITIDENQRYLVEYETFEYTEVLPGMHVHFFFDTVSPEQAGSPGKGPWYLWGGPRPFDGYRVSDRPSAATQMCSLVANSNHSVQANSGTCFPLPDYPGN